MEYYTIEKGRGVLFVSGKYVYKKYNTGGPKTYLECCDLYCKAKAMIADGKLHETTKHLPHDSSLLISELELKARIRKRAENEQTSLREIFESEVRNSNVADRIGFSDVESSMYKRRRVAYPNLPQTLSGFDSKVAESGYNLMINGAPFQRFTIKENGGGFAVLFASDKLLELLISSPIVQLDGSFKQVPSLFDELFVICSLDCGILYPGCFVLIKRPTNSLFKKVYQKFREQNPGFNPKKAIMGFADEEAMSSFVECFPDVVVKGSWHYYIQSLLRILKYTDILEVFISEQAVQDLIHKIACLPLLPSTMIQDAFTSLVHDEDERLADFFDYVGQEWLENAGIEKMSLYGCLESTNIGLESVYSRIGKRMSPCPNLFVFLGKLRKIATDGEADMDKLACGLSVGRQKKRQNVLDNKKVKKALNEFNSQKYDASSFLNATKNAIGKYIAKFTLYDKDIVVSERVGRPNFEDRDDDDPSSIQEVADHIQEMAEADIRKDGICTKCFVTPCDNVAFVPCLHKGFCRKCVKNMSSNNYQCPICQAEVTVVVNL